MSGGWDDQPVVGPPDLDAGLVRRVAAYSARVRAAVLDQHPGASVSSPLGVWLLLCACLLAAEHADGEQLEEVVGCSREEAGALLDAFISEAPVELCAAIALWAREAGSAARQARWSAQLPSKIERGPVPSQAEADAWVQRKTLGLIPAFPVEVSRWDLVLVSALATRVSWSEPYQVGAAGAWFAASSPWLGSVQRVLWTAATETTALVNTAAAGIVAVHEARSQEGLVVICVSADPGAERADVLAAAHEAARHIADGSRLPAVSLFDLPLGPGHSWTISESEQPAYVAGQLLERIADVALPAWEMQRELSLLASPTFGADEALRLLARMRLPRGPSDARQVALATFDRYGFKGAALTYLMVADSAPFFERPQHTGIERAARVRLDHPFAAVAALGARGRFRGLPVFEAWVQSPVEASVSEPPMG